MSPAKHSSDISNLWEYYLSDTVRLDWSLPFTMPAWLESWGESFEHAGEPFIMTAESNGEVAGLAPLLVTDGVAGFLGATDVCDYQDFITRLGAEKAFCSDLLEHLAGDGIEKLDLAHVRPDSVVMTHLVPVARDRGYPVTLSEEDVTIEMPLPNTWDDYLNTLSGKERHEVRRKLRRLGDEPGVIFTYSNPGSELDDRMSEFFQLFALSEVGKAGFMTTPMRSFFTRLAHGMSMAGLLRLGLLEVGGRTAAMTMGFEYRGKAYLYNSAFDTAYRHLSVGILSKVMGIGAAIEAYNHTWDFLKGKERYKQLLGGREVPLYRCEAMLRT